ncbi:MAG TPA: Spy/CpxP family protein refolding chaperone [Methylomirabilota bacterium]|nr:Spy/CpxP family protein refolding chaperone [Methylomirabilota bacterium]
MTDVNLTPEPPAPSPSPSRRRFFRWTAIAATAAVAALATGIGVRAFAHGWGPGGWHRGGFMHGHGPIDPARLDQHLDRMLKHLYVEIDATEAQKQALAPIVKAAARDLLPMRDKFRDAHGQIATLLTQPTIDRAALESLRASQLKLAEDASRRVTRAVADVADVLTPEQRKGIAEHIARRHGSRG